MQTYRCDTAGEIRELFPGGNLRGGKRSELRSPRISPSRSPFLGTLFWRVRCGVGVVVGRFWWGDGFDSIEDARLSRWMRADGKAARVAGLFPVFLVEECL